MSKPTARCSELLVRAFPVGAAPRRDPRRPHHLQRRRAGAQAGHLDHQLHGLRHHRRLDGRHPGQGARGGPHAEGRLRHRLRILDAAPARRVRRRAPARTRPARCRSWISTTRCASPCRRPAAAAARRWARSTSAIRTCKEFIRAKREDGRLRQFNLSLLITDGFMDAVERRQRLAAGVPAARQGTATRRSRRRRRRSSGANGRRTRTTSTREDGLVACKIYNTLRARHLWDMIMVVHLRLCRAGFHPDRQGQRDEQQLVVREHPRHQPLRHRRHLGADRRRSAPGGRAHRQAVHRARRRQGPPSGAAKASSAPRSSR